MPSSHPMQINEIVLLMMTLGPKSLLDVGVGFGKFGFLAREFLELWDGRNVYDQWQRRIDGIEVHEKYITPVHKFIYNNIMVGEALNIVPSLEQRYDLVLLVDIIEHFSLKDGTALLRACLNISRNLLVVTPRNFNPQPEVFGNPYEKHRFHWREEHFKSLANQFIYPNQFSLIVFMGQDALSVYQRLGGQATGPSS